MALYFHYTLSHKLGSRFCRKRLRRKKSRDGGNMCAIIPADALKVTQNSRRINSILRNLIATCAMHTSKDDVVSEYGAAYGEPSTNIANLGDFAPSIRTAGGTSCTHHVVLKRRFTPAATSLYKYFSNTPFLYVQPILTSARAPRKLLITDH